MIWWYSLWLSLQQPYIYFHKSTPRRLIDWLISSQHPDRLTSKANDWPFIRLSNYNHKLTLSSHSQSPDPKNERISVWRSSVPALNTLMYNMSTPMHTPCGANLLCSWWNVDQMAYIPLLSPTWDSESHPPPSSSVHPLKGPLKHTLNKLKIKVHLEGQLAQPHAFSVFTIVEAANQNVHALKNVGRAGLIWNVSYHHHNPVLNMSQEMPGWM